MKVSDKGPLMLCFEKMIFLLISICILLCHSISLAEYITMDIGVKTRLNADILTVSVESTNNGDEPAYNVMVEVEVGGHSKVSNTKESLKVKESLKTRFDFKLSFDKPGSYPVLVRVNYVDVSHYSFSALCLAHINYKEAVFPKLFAKMDTLKITKKGRAHLKVKSLDEKEKELIVRLIVPKDISALNPVKKIRLNSMEEKDLYFPISNFSALLGAKCPIYALMEYDDKERHYSASAMTTVEIIEKVKLTKEYRIVLLGVPLGLLFLYSLFILIRKRKNAKRQSEKP